MNFHCAMCRMVVPVVKRLAGKAVGSAVGGALGLTSRSAGGTIVGLLAGAVVGHVIDEATAPICAHCGTAVSLVPGT